MDNNDRIIVLENVSTQFIGLKDTLGRTYRIGPNGKIRISKMSLQDILDYEASKIIFRDGICQIHNIDADTLFNMGLTDEEITKFAPDAVRPVSVKETKIEAPVIEEVVEEKPAAPKKTATKKTTTTKKSTSSKK